MNDKDKNKDKKICPVMSMRVKQMSGNYNVYCFEEKCAWWTGISCSMSDIADSIYTKLSNPKVLE